MTFTLLLFACATRTPPEGSVELSTVYAPLAAPEQPTAPLLGPPVEGSAELALGQALPFATPSTDPEQALVDAEALLARARAIPRDGDQTMQQATRLVEEALPLLERARKQADLVVPARIRAGDAWRLLVMATLALKPPFGLDREGILVFERERAMAAQEFAFTAGKAYTLALDGGAQGGWADHAEWALLQLERVQ